MEFLFQIVAIVFFGLVLSALYALPVMWLWDWLMPQLFHLQTITLLQAWGLTTLCSLLIKSMSTSGESK